MQLNNILFTNTLMGAMICLLIGLTVIRAKSISLRSFQAVYLLLGAANIAFCYFNFPEVGILRPIAALAAGVVFTFLAAGVFGKRETSAHYETLLVAVGLFPWYLGLRASLVYAAAAILFCVIVKLTKNIAAMGSINYPLKTIWKASKTLPENKLAVYREKSFALLTTPVGVAAVVSALVFATQF
jgi:hypothetical protein